MFQRDISVDGEFSLRSVGTKPQAGLRSLEHQSWKDIPDVAQVTSSPEKKQGFLLPERWLNTESLLKGQDTKFSL